jgi:lysophospholipase L1-like esterase
MTRTHSTRFLRYAVLLAALPAIAGCDDETLMPPEPAGGDLFARYAAIGNSITAGFQSGGINDSTQRQSYAVLLAGQFGLAVGREFRVPLLASPGCPPPLVNAFTQERLAMGTAGDCNLRLPPVPPFLSNVAVPGAAVIDALTNLDADSDPNALTTLILGGRTQLEAAAEVAPTFVTVWIGNNDVLGSILDAADPGNPALVTPPATFATRYADLMSGLDGIGSVQGGALLGVVQVVGAPFLSAGLAYFAAAQQIPTLTVDQNCLEVGQIPGGGPEDTAVVFVPFSYGAPLVAQASAGVPTTLDCSVPQVVSVAETTNLILAVTQYNAAIAAEADARGWVFLDPNALLGQLLADPSAIRPFPAFPPDPAAVEAPFGTALSRDGIHPSAGTHVAVANALIQGINAAYGTSVEPVQ